MSIARAVSKQIVRSSRVKLNSALLYDTHGHHPYLCYSNPRIVMQTSNDRAPPGYHHALARDVSTIFKAYERDENSEVVRNEAFERLRRFVETLGNAGEYELVDVSFGSLSNFPRLYHAPLECTIVDKTRPDGLPPPFGHAALPAAYDPIILAKHLLENGYSGTFVDTRPDLAGFEATDSDALSSRPTSSAEPTWGQLSSPFSSLFNVLPPILRIRPENLDHPEILLSPVHPSNGLRWNLIKNACESNVALRVLSSFFWLWLRSHGLEHYSWTTCVFLVMFFLQDRFKPKLSPSSEPREPQVPLQEALNTIEHSSISRYERALDPQIARPTVHPGKLIDDFFSFWAGNKYLPYSRILDPLTGLHVPRVQKYVANTTDLDETRVMKDLSEKSAEGAKDAFWAYQPLVMADPFLPSHNLAHTVTKNALQHMFYQARITARDLKRGYPLTEVLGSNLSPPILSSVVAQDARGLLVGWQEQSAPNLQTGGLPSGSGSAIQRMYHTSARVEGRKKEKEPLVLPAIRAPTEAPPAVIAARQTTVQKVRRIIRERYGKQYFVECFGSTQYGVDSATSDLDLVVLDQDRITGFTPDVTLEALPVIYNVKHLASSLERSGFRITRVVKHATVPIVKFEDPRTRLSCDININDRLGLFNTRLIAQYCMLSPLLRPLLMLLKKWAKTLGLNDPSGEGGAATFSSYALTLMTIGFLQTHELLPNLQADLPPLKPEEAFWICGKDYERAECDPRYSLSPSWMPSTNIMIQDLRGALIAWFRFWAHQFNYSTQVMSIRDGGVVPRSEPSTSTKTADKQRRRRHWKIEKREKQERKAAEKAARKAARKAYADLQYRLKRGLPPDANLEALAATEGVGNEAMSNEAIGDEVENDSKSVSGTEAASENDAEEDEDAVVDDVDQDQDAIEEMDQTDVQQGRQPRSWAQAALVVADPFIVAKNTTMALTPISLAHFTAECKRSLLLLSTGANFEDLLGDGSAAWRHGGRRKNRGGGRGKRGHEWRDVNNFVVRERQRQRRERETWKQGERGKGKSRERDYEKEQEGNESKTRVQNFDEVLEDARPGPGEFEMGRGGGQRRARSHPHPRNQNQSRPSSAVRDSDSWDTREVQSDRDGAGMGNGRGRGWGRGAGRGAGNESTSTNWRDNARGGGAHWMGRGRAKGRWTQRGNALREEQQQHSRARSQSQSRA